MAFSFWVKDWGKNDNPVCIDPQEEDAKPDEYLYLVPIESEIYFPLSPDYCLFAFHKNSKKAASSLRNLAPDKIHLVNDQHYERICRLLGASGHDYFILNTETEKTFLNG